MPNLRFLAALGLLAACDSKSSPASTATDAAVVKDAALGSSSSSSSSKPVDAGPAPPWRETFDTLPSASENLRPVAIGRSAQSRVLWLKLHGEVMWLSAVGTDALAERSGALTKVTDPLEKLPLQRATQDVQVVGFHPNLIALRTEKTGPAKPAAFFLKNGNWTPSDAMPFERKPIAFLAYRTGALAVIGHYDPAKTPNAAYSGDRGTSLINISAAGKVSTYIEPKDEQFIAWNGDWDASGISLVGAIAEKGADGKSIPTGTHVFQLAATDGSSSMLQIQKNPHPDSVLPVTAVYRNRGMTTVEPIRAAMVDNDARWLPNVATTIGVTNDGQRIPRAVATNHTCELSRSRILGSHLYTIQVCHDGNKKTVQLLRANSRGVTELIDAPSLPGKTADAGDGPRCDPTELVAGRNDELWIQASCPGGIPAVFRRDAAQEPIAF